MAEDTNDEMSDEQFAAAFAGLLEVVQGGVMRPATPADVLEILGSGGKRYVLKGKDGRYIARDGSGWTRSQREAAVIEDRASAKTAQQIGLREHGVETRVVRVRRRGTLRIEGVRLRPDLGASVDGGAITMMLKDGDVAQLMAAIGKKRG